MRYQHFTIEEREKIQRMLWQKQSVRSIAKAMGRSPSSISREIKRNKPPQRNLYTPRLAHEKALKNRKRRGREERLKNSILREYVVSRLKLRWSPEQIAATSKKAIGTSISHEAIYQYIYAQIHRDGYGYVKPGKEDCAHILLAAESGVCAKASAVFAVWKTVPCLQLTTAQNRLNEEKKLAIGKMIQ